MGAPDQRTGAGPTGDPAASCEECGYSLLGLVDGGAEPVCPECGTPFDPSMPWRAGPWPRPWRAAAMLCGPAASVLAALLGLTAFGALRNVLVWPLWFVWILVIGATVLLVPISVAASIARSTTPRLFRRAAARRLWGPAIACNAIATALALLAFWAML